VPAPRPRLHAPDRRRQLLETALDLFSRKGFRGTTTKAIAKAAGVTEAIIFRHFPTKEALYAAVLDCKHESGEIPAMFEQWQAFMDANDDVGLFHSMIRSMIEGYRRDTRVKRALLFAALEGHVSGLEQHVNRSLPTFGLICKYVARRQSEGAIRSGNPGSIVAAIVGVASNYGMMTEFFGFSTNMEDSQVTEDFLDLILHGIQPTPTTEKAN
jgi:TetR/AcrR family transcriptional regulator